jgi:hypothetical protein
VPQNTFKKSEKEEYLDNYFRDQLQKIINKINTPESENRKDHVEYILDSLMTIADEYQAVMVEKEEGYWTSIEMWQDELQQRTALNWVNENIKNGKGIN